MVHYYDHIKNFGSPNGLCSSITESKHITAVKRPWRRSNKHIALPQILKVNERLDKIAAARADFTARGMLMDSCLVQAIKDAFGDDPIDEDASDSETDSGSSDGETEVFSPQYAAGTWDFGNTGARSHGHADTHSPDDTNTHIPDDTNDGPADDIDEHALNGNHPHVSRQPSPAPLNDGDLEDDDCGPVESGPLMNEVRLVGRKGQSGTLPWVT